MMPALLEFIAG